MTISHLANTSPFGPFTCMESRKIHLTNINAAMHFFLVKQSYLKLLTTYKLEHPVSASDHLIVHLHHSSTRRSAMFKGYFVSLIVEWHFPCGNQVGHLLARVFFNKSARGRSESRVVKRSAVNKQNSVLFGVCVCPTPVVVAIGYSPTVKQIFTKCYYSGLLSLYKQPFAIQ